MFDDKTATSRGQYTAWDPLLRGAGIKKSVLKCKTSADNIFQKIFANRTINAKDTGKYLKNQHKATCLSFTDSKFP